MNTKFLDFFKEGGKLSMGRLIFFICGLSALVVTVSSVPLALKGVLGVEYVGLCATLWAAAFGGKNWAKSIELKSKTNEG